jgi:hypothetical protein
VTAQGLARSAKKCRVVDARLEGGRDAKTLAGRQGALQWWKGGGGCGSVGCETDAD